MVVVIVGGFLVFKINGDLGNGEGDLDSGDVPSSLASLVPIVIATLQIEEENPRVAYLCEYFSLNFDYFFNLFYQSLLKK